MKITQISKNIFLKLFFYSLFCFFLFSCKSEEKKKEDLASKIAQESCERISKLSTNIVGGIISGFINSITGGGDGLETGSFGKIPNSWCSCYCYIVSKELTDKYSSKELKEIYNDKNLQFLLIEKILSLRKSELQSCIMQTTKEKLNSYQELKKRLDEKFN